MSFPGDAIQTLRVGAQDFQPLLCVTGKVQSLYIHWISSDTQLFSTFTKVYITPQHIWLEAGMLKEELNDRLL